MVATNTASMQKKEGHLRARGGSGFDTFKDDVLTGLRTDDMLGALLESLRTHPSAAPCEKYEKYMHLRVGSSTKERRVSWYDPCEPWAIDMLIRTACGVPPEAQYLLLDSKSMSAVAISSSLPSRSTFEVVLLASPTHLAATPGAIVVVDPISTGAVLSFQIARERGLRVIAVWSDAIPDELKEYIDPRCGIDYAARIQHSTGALDETVAAVRGLGLDVRECMVGCETGVLLNDQLAEALGVRGNGTAKSNLRRNKYLQTEALRTAGLNACGQMLAETREDVERFLAEKPKSSRWVWPLLAHTHIPFGAA